MVDEADMQSEVGIVAIPFVTKLKAFLSLSFITKSIAIILLIAYGLNYQRYIISSPPIRPILKSHHSNMYSDYFVDVTGKKNASLIIIVLSAIEKYERRKAIRETWWKECQKHRQVVCKFMIDTINNSKDNNRILQEINSTRDVIVSPINQGMLFGHRILFAMQWSIHHYNFDYLMRVDDDVLICIEHLIHRNKLIPRTGFMSGVLHCADQGMVYLDEGIVTFSQDVVQLFLSQDPDYMYCHIYGDQTYSTWINDLKVNGKDLYHIETRIHHHPPASRVPNLRNRTKICNRYIALHGVYGDDMKKFWTHRGLGSFPNNTGLMKLNQLCPYEATYNWKKFGGMYNFEPRLCNDPQAWTGVRGVVFSRES